MFDTEVSTYVKLPQKKGANAYDLKLHGYDVFHDAMVVHPRCNEIMVTYYE